LGHGLSRFTEPASLLDLSFSLTTSLLLLPLTLSNISSPAEQVKNVIAQLYSVGTGEFVLSSASSSSIG
jgi:hypothetical protein